MEGATLSRWPMIAITLLRIFVGWHFLYEGIAKLTSPAWSAAGYLRQARGPFAGLFKWLASQPNLLANADFITMWGLTLVGVLLVLGLFTRLASLAGIGFILLFYLCNPPGSTASCTYSSPGGRGSPRRDPRCGLRTTMVSWSPTLQAETGTGGRHRLACARRRVGPMLVA